MRISYELKIWAFIILHAVTVEGACPGGQDCIITPGQIGTSQAATLLLGCDSPTCQSAIFVPSSNTVCLFRSQFDVKIFLGNCPQFFTNPGYFISTSANVVPSGQGIIPSNTAFTDTSCEAICEHIDVVLYTGISNDQTLIAYNTQLSTSSISSCSQAFYLYPDVSAFGACNISTRVGERGGKGTPPKRQCPSRTRQSALLTTTDDVSEFAVGAPEQLSDGSHRMPIVEKREGEVFFIQKYTSKAIGANGTIELVTAYTLQLARSKKYLVADVLDDTTLNYTGPNSTGLNLKDASEFPAGYATSADYRLFVRYNVTVGRVNATVFCPLFHRNYCILPAVSGYLRLTHLKNANFSVEPTFVNPTDQELRDFVISNSSHPNLVGPWHVALRVL